MTEHPWFRKRGKWSGDSRQVCGLAMVAAAKRGDPPACSCGLHSKAEQLQAAQAGNAP